LKFRILILAISLLLISSAQSFLDAEATTWRPFVLRIDDQSYPIAYNVTGGSLENMVVDQSKKSLTVFLVNTVDDGKLSIDLPRQILDSKDSSGNDLPFVASIAAANSTSKTTVLVNEIGTTDSKRTIEVEFNRDTRIVEIRGTYVIPEFGSLAILVVAISIAGVIVTRQYIRR
jgi:predicted secreted protein with PEFG-CTERM motif